MPTCTASVERLTRRPASSCSAPSSDRPVLARKTSSSDGACSWRCWTWMFSASRARTTSASWASPSDRSTAVPLGDELAGSPKRASTSRVRARSPSSAGMISSVGRLISALSASGVPSATMHPLSMIPMRSASTSASSRYCVVRKTVTPLSEASRWTSSQSALRLWGSRPGRRLVEEQDARLVHERQRQVEPPLHPARVAADLAVGRLGEPDAGEQLAGPALALLRAHAVQRGLEPHVLGAGEERVERGLLERGADRGAHLVALGDDVVARRPARCPTWAAAAW